MANFNYEIGCETNTTASDLRSFIDDCDFYHENLELYEDIVGFTSKQGMIEVLSRYFDSTGHSMEIEIWPEHMDYEEAVENNELEIFNFIKGS